MLVNENGWGNAPTKTPKKEVTPKEEPVSKQTTKAVQK